MGSLRIVVLTTEDEYGCDGEKHFKENWNVFPEIPVEYQKVNGAKYDKAQLFGGRGLVGESSCMRLDLLSNLISKELRIR